ncbi:hypothetical protein D3C75_625690 [compost metagenome]
MIHVSKMMEDLEAVCTDAERYRKLRGWMTAGVQEGWNEVEKLGAIGAYLSWDDFDSQLDSLPVCNVGLCEVLVERS